MLATPSQRSLFSFFSKILGALLLLGAGAASATDAPPGVRIDAQGNTAIVNIDQLLNSCPTNDPAVAEIRNDFEIRRNGVTVGAISCSEPVSSMTTTQYADEVIVLQGLRVLYYMDKGRSGHLPWTSGSLYQWMKSKIGGIDIRNDTTISSCCSQSGGRNFFIAAAQDDFNRDFDRSWEGISGNIALYVHEARHVDGFGHTSCCGITGGCDDNYAESNLSAYALQWWLNAAWLKGTLNVGTACLSSDRQQSIANWMESSLDGYVSRFCYAKPPSFTPAAPIGGACPADPLPPAWAVNVAYATGARVSYNSRIYEATQAHTSQANWAPTQAITLWNLPTPTALVPWEAQTRYVVGSEVTYQGVKYIALAAHISQVNWTPPVSSTLWRRE